MRDLPWRGSPSTPSRPYPGCPPAATFVRQVPGAPVHRRGPAVAWFLARRGLPHAVRRGLGAANGGRSARGGPAGRDRTGLLSVPGGLIVTDRRGSNPGQLVGRPPAVGGSFRDVSAPRRIRTSDVSDVPGLQPGPFVRSGHRRLMNPGGAVRHALAGHPARCTRRPGARGRRHLGFSTMRRAQIRVARDSPALGGFHVVGAPRGTRCSSRADRMVPVGYFSSLCS